VAQQKSGGAKTPLALPSLVPRPSNGSSTRCNNKGCNWGGAKSGSKERGPGAWGYPKSVPYASIPAYEECLITDHKYVIAVLHSTAHSAIYLLTHEPELVGMACARLRLDDIINAAAAQLSYHTVKKIMREAVKEFVDGKDVFVALPTGVQLSSVNLIQSLLQALLQLLSSLSSFDIRSNVSNEAAHVGNRLRWLRYSLYF